MLGRGPRSAALGTPPDAAFVHGELDAPFRQRRINPRRLCQVAAGQSAAKPAHSKSFQCFVLPAGVERSDISSYPHLSHCQIANTALGSPVF